MDDTIKQPAAEAQPAPDEASEGERRESEWAEAGVRLTAWALTIGHAFLDRAARGDPDQTIGGKDEDGLISACLADIAFALDLVAWIQRIGLNLPAAQTIRGVECPPAIALEIGEYWTSRTHPRPFLFAVLANDLVAACRLANDFELAHLHAIVHQVAQGHPDSWGSVDKVRAWIKPGQTPAIRVPAPGQWPALSGGAGQVGR